MSLLAQREAERREARLRLFESSRLRLRTALRELAPGREFLLFGSLIQPGRFNAESDVDLGFTELPPGKSEYLLAAELEERLGRPIDLIDLNRSRLRDKILREGERWIA
ncbi:MAG: nucleotidyltransferase family protein [Opitutaceae bacterium]